MLTSPAEAECPQPRLHQPVISCGLFGDVFLHAEDISFCFQFIECYYEWA